MYCYWLYDNSDEMDPWNAVAVVGLRVYAKAKTVEKEAEVEAKILTCCEQAKESDEK